VLDLLHSTCTWCTAAQSVSLRSSRGIDIPYYTGLQVTELLRELELIQKTAPGSKSLVFTSWPRFLNLIADALTKEGVSFAKVVGSAEHRTQQVDLFKSDSSCHVMLMVAAHMSGAAGLNLTCATTAFLMEPNLDKSIEDQAAGRICRLGKPWSFAKGPPALAVILPVDYTLNTQLHNSQVNCIAALHKCGVAHTALTSS
jgi:SNF2 family DNA or RNA helicase